MTEIRIDADKAERIMAQILRDDFGMLPAKANQAAATMRRRLDAAMPAPVNPELQGYRLIQSHPPFGGDFTAAVGLKLADVNDRVARELWKLVYERATALPPGVADALR